MQREAAKGAPEGTPLNAEIEIGRPLQYLINGKPHPALATGATGSDRYHIIYWTGTVWETLANVEPAKGSPLTGWRRPWG